MELARHLNDSAILLVDVSRRESYIESHIPGAVHLDYSDLVCARPPAAGLLPDEDRLADTIGRLGITPDRHVIAYDEEGGVRATRLLWTLDVIGHQKFSLLNGGLLAWESACLPTTCTELFASPIRRSVAVDRERFVDKEWILTNLENPRVVIVDTRSQGEYEGRVSRAARRGHIPGALHFDYLNAIDAKRDLRIREPEELKRAFLSLGVEPQKEIIVYCQTHHRSSHTYFVLRYLCYPHVRAYPGSWSEWGNSAETPINV